MYNQNPFMTNHAQCTMQWLKVFWKFHVCCSSQSLSELQQGKHINIEGTDGKSIPTNGYTDCLKD